MEREGERERVRKNARTRRVYKKPIWFHQSNKGDTEYIRYIDTKRTSVLVFLRPTLLSRCVYNIANLLVSRGFHKHEEEVIHHALKSSI